MGQVRNANLIGKKSGIVKKSKFRILLDVDDTTLSGLSGGGFELNNALFEALAELGIDDVGIVTAHNLSSATHDKAKNSARYHVVDRLKKYNINTKYVVLHASPILDNGKIGSFYEDHIKPREILL